MTRVNLERLTVSRCQAEPRGSTRSRCSAGGVHELTKTLLCLHFVLPMMTKKENSGKNAFSRHTGHAVTPLHMSASFAPSPIAFILSRSLRDARGARARTHNVLGHRLSCLHVAPGCREWVALITGAQFRSPTASDSSSSFKSFYTYADLSLSRS